MNILLSILQILLALHTIMGAMWKLSNSEQTVTSLKAIPHALWQSLSIIEILCALGLIIPGISKGLGILIPIAAICIAAEMLLFSVVHIYSDEVDNGPMIYWLVVAAICVFIAYGRLKLKPL